MNITANLKTNSLSKDFEVEVKMNDPADKNKDRPISTHQSGVETILNSNIELGDQPFKQPDSILNIQVEQTH